MDGAGEGKGFPVQCDLSPAAAAVCRSSWDGWLAGWSPGREQAKRRRRTKRSDERDTAAEKAPTIHVTSTILFSCCVLPFLYFLSLLMKCGWLGVVCLYTRA